MSKLLLFDKSQVDTVQELRRSASLLRNLAIQLKEHRLPPERIEEGGWRTSIFPPMAILGLFEAKHILEIKEGYTLHGYQQFGDPYTMGGEGLVYAMRINVRFPEPEECMVPTKEDVRLLVPKPSDALEHVMLAVKPSFGRFDEETALFTSILFRELCEFGAYYHAIDWGNKTILTSAPWEHTGFVDSHRPGPADEWKMTNPNPPFMLPEVESKPFWGPHAVIDDATITIIINVFTAHNGARVIQYRDTYRAETGLVPEVSAEVIANGQGGFLY